MWYGFLPFAILVLITAVVFSVRAIRARRQVNEKMNELENEWLQLLAKSDKKQNDPKKDNSHKA